MWFNRKRSATTLTLVEGTFTCTGTLVLHADGSDECEHAHECAGDELVHEHVVACHELGCACTGEELVLAA